MAGVTESVSERRERATCLGKSLKTIKDFDLQSGGASRSPGAGDHCVLAHMWAAGLEFDELLPLQQ